VAAAGHGHRRGGLLANLSVLLRVRYDQHRASADLTEAVTTGTAAAAALPSGSPARWRNAVNLATALTTRVQAGGDLADLDTAIDLCRTAVAETFDGEPALTVVRSTLAGAVQIRFDAHGDARDLDQAVTLLDECVRAARPGSNDWADLLSNLAVVLRSRFSATGDHQDLDRGIDCCRQASTAAPADHPDQGLYLSTLAATLLQRFTVTTNEDDREAAIAAARRASAVTAAAPTIRLGSALAAADAELAAGRPDRALSSYGDAIRLLTRVAWHGLDRATREAHLAGMPEATRDATACAMAAGQPGLAVETAEQGRSVLWAQQLEVRGDLSRLAAADPATADRLTKIAAALERTALIVEIESGRINRHAE
jgi:tetratricopeptide (TPR) repeat protein